MSEKKQCRSCKKRLSSAAFNQSLRSADLLSNTCRACTNARRRKRDRKASRPKTQSTVGAALRAGDIELLKKWIGTGKVPHWSWICETMRTGNVAAAEFLKQQGADTNIFTWSAMGDSNAVSRRLRRVPTDCQMTTSMEPGCAQVTALHIACSSNWSAVGVTEMKAQVRIAELLLQHGADVNASARYRNLEDSTPIFCACWSSENLLLVRFLLENGAVATDRELWTALGHFQRHTRPDFELAETLLNTGISVDGGSPGERTALQGFAHQAAHRAVEWLLSHGAQVNARCSGGRTAAHFAAERNTGVRTLQILVEHGADLTVRDDDGHRPIDLAKLHGKHRLVDWLRRNE